MHYNQILVSLAPTAAIIAAAASVASLVVAVVRWRREEARVAEEQAIRDA